MISDGESDGSAASIMATTPATCGVAWLVPDIVAESVSDPFRADWMRDPGAKMSTQGPKLLQEGLLSNSSIAPTVITSGMYAGAYPQASLPLLAAATTTGMPALTARSTTVCMNMVVSSRFPPELALMIAGLSPLAITQFTPCANIHHAPDPRPVDSLTSRTLTEWSVTPLATPYRWPPMMAATCVPCPPSSVAHFASMGSHLVALGFVASSVGMARPPKSSCVVRIPLSRT
mmetsp:Transcript_16364/g.41159  ORF Transcript_16364/g.41159 Transcript_16364/m.41159 type:complete len:232 (-) Transcript_16364:30-725(-)